MKEQAIAWVLIVIGIFLIVLFNSEIMFMDEMPQFLKDLSENKTGIIIGIVFVVVGLFFMFRKGKVKGSKEVPIYRGKHVVGYRRV